MRTHLLLVSILLIPVFAAGQAVVTTSNVATTAGAMISPAPPSAPLVSTPILSLGTAAPSPVGASNGTANNAAGASNATLSTLAPAASAVVTQPQFALPLSAESATATTAAAPQNRGLNLGLAHFSSVYNPAAPNEGSLGEIARAYKQAKAQHRLYTNDDVARVKDQKTVKTGS
jgi:hypothetical protein